MSGDIFGCHTGGMGVLLVGGGQECSKRPAMHRTVPPTQRYQTNINRTTLQKPCPKGSIVAYIFPNLPDHKNSLGKRIVLVKNTRSRSYPDLLNQTLQERGLGIPIFKQLSWVNFMIKQVWKDRRWKRLSFQLPGPLV